MHCEYTDGVIKLNVESSSLILNGCHLDYVAEKMDGDEAGCYGEKSNIIFLTEYIDINILMVLFLLG